MIIRIQHLKCITLITQLTIQICEIRILEPILILMLTWNWILWKATCWKRLTVHLMSCPWSNPATISTEEAPPLMWCRCRYCRSVAMNQKEYCRKASWYRRDKQLIWLHLNRKANTRMKTVCSTSYSNSNQRNSLTWRGSPGRIPIIYRSQSKQWRKQASLRYPNCRKSLKSKLP